MVIIIHIYLYMKRFTDIYRYGIHRYCICDVIYYTFIHILYIDNILYMILYISVYQISVFGILIFIYC